jgi:hypothetical protein
MDVREIFRQSERWMKLVRDNGFLIKSDGTSKTAATLLVIEQVGSSSTASRLYFGDAWFGFVSGHRLA